MENIMDPDDADCWSFGSGSATLLYSNCWVFMKFFAEMGFFWLFRPMLWGEWRRRWLFWWRGCWSLRTFSRPLGPATNLRPANHRGPATNRWPTNHREPAANLQSVNHRRPTTNLQWANYRRLVANLHGGWFCHRRPHKDQTPGTVSQCKRWEDRQLGIS